MEKLGARFDNNNELHMPPKIQSVSGRNILNLIPENVIFLYIRRYNQQNANATNGMRERFANYASE